MVNQTKQRKMRRSTSKKTKSRTHKHANRRVSRSNKMRGGGEVIQFQVMGDNEFKCIDTTPEGIKLGFIKDYYYNISVSSIPKTLEKIEDISNQAYINFNENYAMYTLFNHIDKFDLIKYSFKRYYPVHNTGDNFNKIIGVAQSIDNIYITKFSANFPNNILKMYGTNEDYTFNVEQKTK